MICVIFSILLVGSMLILKDLPVVSGSILASGTGERRSLRIFAPCILLAGVILPLFLAEDPVSTAAGTMFIPETSGDILAVGMATAFASLIAGQFSRFPAVPYAFVASLAGVSISSGDIPDVNIFLSYVLSWIAAPLLCALVAAVVYRTYALSLKDRTIHLALLDARLQVISILFSFLLLVAAAINNSLLFSYLPGEMDVSPAWRAVVVAGCVIAVYPFLHRKVCLTKWNIADNDLDVNSQSISSLIISMFLTLCFFSSPLPGKIGLTATPLSAGSLFVAALAGISITRRRALTDGPVIVRSLIAATLSPILALMFAFCLARIMDGVFLGIVFVVILALFVVGIVLFIRWQNTRDLQKRILLSREQQVYSTQKSLSALEVKAEMTEKDLLDKLDGKRKELVDFALGIGDQKKFMEKFYDDLKEVRAMPDGPGKDAMTDSLLSSMRERMYFTSEINDFYARSEVLHKDFNRRLGEAYPNLTENERKLANLLRQGFSSKYIASLMNITPKSVEINRYRLRAKLGLKRSDNLIKFIKSI